jgi:hypothetical protein
MIQAGHVRSRDRAMARSIYLAQRHSKTLGLAEAGAPPPGPHQEGDQDALS